MRVERIAALYKKNHKQRNAKFWSYGSAIKPGPFWKKRPRSSEGRNAASNPPNLSAAASDGGPLYH